MTTPAVAALLAARLASAQAPAPVAAAPRPVSVAMGLGGITTWQASCVPVRVILDATSGAIDETLLIRTPAGPVTWEMTVRAEPGARRTLHAVACLPGYGGGSSWQWSLDGTTWQDAGARVLTPPLVATVGAQVGRIAALEQAIAPQWQQARTPPAAAPKLPVEPHTVGLAPGEAPVDPAGWEVADIVLVDARDGAALSPEAQTALLDHVASGATLIVAGAESSGLPDQLLAARPSTPTTASVVTSDGEAEVAALQLDPLAGAEALALAGAPGAPAFARPCGLGRLVTIGLDLTGSAARDALTEADWKTIAGARAVGGGAIRSDDQWLDPIRAVLQQQSTISATNRGIVPPLAAAIYLGAAAAFLGVGGVVLSRRSGGATPRRQVALLLLGVSAPGFLVGAFRRHSKPEDLVVVEHFESTGRSHVVRWVTLLGKGRVDVPAGVVRLDAVSALRAQLPESRVRLGSRPAIELMHEPGLSRVVGRVDTWVTEQESPRTRLLASSWPRGVVANGSMTMVPTGSASPLPPPLLTAASTGVLAWSKEGVVALEPTTPPTLWIVHR